MRPWPVLLTLMALAGAAGAAADVKAGELTIRDAQIRAVPPGVPNSAGYLTIANAGDKADRLVSAACACARSVEIHFSHVMNGSAMMMPSGPVEAPAHGEVSFSPGSYHLMIVGLKAPLADGAIQTLTLKFQHAGTVSVPFAVRTRIQTASAR